MPLSPASAQHGTRTSQALKPHVREHPHPASPHLEPRRPPSCPCSPRPASSPDLGVVSDSRLEGLVGHVVSQAEGHVVVDLEGVRGDRKRDSWHIVGGMKGLHMGWGARHGAGVALCSMPCT